MARNIEEVQKEYQMQASLLGDLEYRMSKLTEDRERMINHMHNLNVEAKKIADAAEKAKESEAQPEAAPEVANEQG